MMSSCLLISYCWHVNFIILLPYSVLTPPPSLSRTKIISCMHDNILYLQNNITHPNSDPKLASNTKGGDEDILQHHCYLVTLF